MQRTKSILKSTVFTFGVLAVPALQAHAQSANLPLAQITDGLPDITVYSDDQMQQSVIYDSVAGEPYVEAAGRVIDTTYNALMTSLPDGPDFFVTNEDGDLNFVVFPYELQGQYLCGDFPLNGITEFESGHPYILMPSAFIGKDLPSAPTEDVDGNTMRLAAQIGTAQTAIVCREFYNRSDLAGSPYAIAMYQLGWARGAFAHSGIGLDLRNLDGKVRYWGYAREIVNNFNSGRMSAESFDVASQVFLNRSPMTEPFLLRDVGYDMLHLFIMEHVDLDLSNFLRSAPDDPLSTVSTLAWLDDALQDDNGNEHELGKLIPILNFLTATNGVFQTENTQRSVWQRGLNGDPEVGCEELDLRSDNPFGLVEFELQPGGSYCVSLGWDGETIDPELPPQISVVGYHPDADVAALMGLQMAADQRPSQAVRVIEGAAPDDSLVINEPGIWRFYRNGIVVENPVNDAAAKDWEIVFRPDRFFSDERMTIVFSNLRRDDVEATTTQTFRVAFGEGRHEMEPDLQVTTFDEEDDQCRSPQRIAPPIPPGPLILAEAGRTIYGQDGLGFDRAPTFGATYIVGQPDPAACGRILTSLGIGSAGEDMSLAIVGGAAPGAVAGDPQAICAARMGDLTASIGNVLSGNFDSIGSRFQLDLEITPRSALNGPGIYDADFSLIYTQSELERRGLLEPTYTDARGTITVIDQTPASIHLRYDVQLDDRNESCEGRLEGSISGEIHTAYVLSAEDELIAYALHPRDVLGEPTWRQMPASVQRDMIAEWQAEPTSELRTGASSNSAPQRAEAGIGADCTVTEEEIDQMIAIQLEGIPEELLPTYNEMFQELHNPEYPMSVLCVMKDELLE